MPDNTDITVHELKLFFIGMFPVDLKAILESHHLSESCRLELEKHVSGEAANTPIQDAGDVSSSSVQDTAAATSSIVSTDGPPDTSTQTLCDKCGNILGTLCDNCLLAHKVTIDSIFEYKYSESTVKPICNDLKQNKCFTDKLKM